MKVTFCGVEYKSKKALLEYVNSVLDKIPHGLIYPEDEEYKFLLELYKRHPNQEVKEYFPECFSVQPCFTGGQHITFKNLKNEFQPFSKHNCINQRVDSIYKQNIDTLRLSILPQILKYGRAKKCCICGCNESLQCDHVIPFNQILKQFVWSEDFYNKYGSNNFSKGYSMKEILSDALLSQEMLNLFTEYHNKEAQYRTLCFHCNISEYQKYKNGLNTSDVRD